MFYHTRRIMLIQAGCLGFTLWRTASW